ncbi:MULTISPECIES: hypothetical protein [unclassified Chitinophaga]|uniref:hypothetical protein n=1 Tax=unclassified Chitinophaga TaxID=2619133 RepID=UPI0009C504C4|nr:MULTISPECIES: hypothetical protein [unclassified Chitinophaga]OMP74680.1 hypothetical protein BW716_34030 [[Flexibacter] sp. ATCC 35208]WPV64292.1 hypothetical protein QQL36_21045 [Chitinophaga sp. LS1]
MAQPCEGCLNSTAYVAKAHSLRTKLLQVCKAGGDLDHPNGASTVPGAAPSGGYVSFKEAIIGCNNCRYLLADEIQLPVFMDSGAQGYVSGFVIQFRILILKVIQLV